MIETIFGPVGIKVGHMGSLEKISPEYEDCARIAREQGIPLTKVYSIAAEACTEEIGETPWQIAVYR